MRRLFMAAVACAVIQPSDGMAQRAPDLRKPAGKEWLTIGGDWGNTRYSTLTQINRNNVKNLKGAWVVHLGSGLAPK
jgi:glucose dehydrogenase